MKTTLKSPVPEFKPFTIEITFDTLEEAKLIDHIFQANLRIPNMFIEDGTLKTIAESDNLLKLMKEIRKPLYKGIYNRDYKGVPQ